MARAPMTMGRFRTLVRQAVASPHVSRIRQFGGLNVPANTTTAFNLLTCDDDPDYDLATDGTNVAQVQPFSKITNINLRVRLEPVTSELLEWCLVKDPDGAIVAGGAVPSTLFVADVSNLTIVMRKYTLKYGWFQSSTAADSQSLNMRIKRKALKRAGLMHDGDTLTFLVRNSHASTAARFWFTGTVTTTGR